MAVKSSVLIVGDEFGEGWYNTTVVTEKFTVEDCIEKYMDKCGDFDLDKSKVVFTSPGVFVLTIEGNDGMAIITKQMHVKG